MQKEEQWRDLFYQTLMELDYTQDESRREKRIEQATRYSDRVPNLNGWPDDLQAFWNGESFGWSKKIDTDVRQAITDDLAHLDGYNLDIGGGSMLYMPGSVVMDISEDMLTLNDAASKVHGSAEEPLPFERELFDSVTMIFLVGYIKNVEQLFHETHRVLKNGGKAVIIQSINPIFVLHRSHYQNGYELPELQILLQSIGFSVHAATKDYAGKKCIYIEAEKTLRRPMHL